jgi:N-ethylmaleimide reductase
MKPYVTPRALELEEIPQIIEQYRLGAKNALEAGFDGVEIHSANGYLLDQFLQDNTNQRTDIYGGSVENRARLLLEVTEAVVSVWGSDRVGVRLSPSGTFGSVYDSNRAVTFGYAVKELNRFNLAYLHLVAPRVEGFGPAEDQPDLGADFFRPIFNSTIITAGGYTLATGNAAIASGAADLVAFGRLYIANPDLVERFAANAPLNTPDRNTFYGGDEKGYTDYPSL